TAVIEHLFSERHKQKFAAVLTLAQIYQQQLAATSSNLNSTIIPNIVLHPADELDTDTIKITTENAMISGEIGTDHFGNARLYQSNDTNKDKVEAPQVKLPPQMPKGKPKRGPGGKKKNGKPKNKGGSDANALGEGSKGSVAGGSKHGNGGVKKTQIGGGSNKKKGGSKKGHGGGRGNNGGDSYDFDAGGIDDSDADDLAGLIREIDTGFGCRPEGGAYKESNV
ncbi:hypothetical protein H0H93_013380, partial [Arthromyces matolae]